MARGESGEGSASGWGQQGLLQDGDGGQFLLSDGKRQGVRVRVLKGRNVSLMVEGRWRVDEQEPGCTWPRLLPQPLATGPLTCHWGRLGQRRGCFRSEGGGSGPGRARGWRSRAPVKVQWGLEFRPGTHLSPACMPQCLPGWAAPFSLHFWAGF